MSPSPRVEGYDERAGRCVNSPGPGQTCRGGPDSDLSYDGSGPLPSPVTTIRVHKKDRYTAVAREPINDTRLSFRARGILVWLLDKPNDWRCDSTQIASQTKEGRDAVRAALRELEAAGYLVRQRSQDERGRWVQSCVIYEVPPETGFQAPENQSSVDQSSVDQSSVSQALLQRLSPTTVNKTPRRERASTEEPPGFAAFYEQYPRKEARPKALAAYLKALKAGHHHGQIIDGLSRWNDYWTAQRTERKFIPLPASFLNAHKFNDEPPASRRVQRESFMHDGALMAPGVFG